MNNEWITSAFAVNELAPEDVILHKVVTDILKPDPTLRRIFGEEWIRAVPWLDPLDFVHFPTLDVACYSLDETPGVGVLSDTISLYLQVRFERVESSALEHGQATIGTLFRHIYRVLTAEGAKQLHNQLGSGDPFQLVKRSDPGPAAFRIDQDPSGGRFAYAAVRQWDYKCFTDPATGRIRNLVLAGG